MIGWLFFVLLYVRSSLYGAELLKNIEKYGVLHYTIA